MSRTYRFVTDLRCYLANGDVDILRDYEVAVDAGSLSEARTYLREIATEMVHDAGSRLLDAPLDYLEVIDVIREPQA